MRHHLKKEEEKMFLYKSVKYLQPEARKRDDLLRAECYRLKADLDYLAMMTEIPLEENENEQN